MGDRHVAGYCPMGCGETLFLGSEGYITCGYLPCPNPTAVADLLDDQETEHIVTFGDDGFTIRHPLRERLGDALMDCALHAYCESLDGPPVALGRYRTSLLANGKWYWGWIAEPASKENADA